MEMDKFQLIDAMINDLGNENTGLQVRGYRNTKIVSSVLEALVQLKEQLQTEEKDTFERIAKLEAKAKGGEPDEN